MGLDDYDIPNTDEEDDPLDPDRCRADEQESEIFEIEESVGGESFYKYKDVEDN